MRSVLVTGASSGIGRATALRLDAAGWRVFAGVRGSEAGNSLLRAGSTGLVPLQLEITDRTQVEAACEQVAEVVGPSGLDGLVNNAGITIPCPLEVLPLDDFQRLMATNVTGQLAVTQAFLPQLRAARGRITFVSSISGRRAIPMLAAYSASKAGLDAVADGFRQELRNWGIKVSVVEPGAIETPIWDRGESELERALSCGSAEVNDLYAGLIASFRDLFVRARGQRIPPARVAAAIEHALTARRPRLHYLVGRDAKGQAWAMRLLPDRVLDFGISRYLRA